MPTNISKIHQLCKLKLNKLDSNSNYDLSPAFIDLLAWETLNEYIDIFYSGSDKQLKLGFESTQQRIDMLKDFVVSYPEQNLLSPISSSFYRDGFYITLFNLNSLVKKYKHFLRGVVYNNCNNSLKIDIETTNSLDYKLNNSYEQPSSKWKTCLGLIENNILKIYSDSPILNLELTFLKVPTKCFFGGYNTFEYLNGDLNAPHIGTAKVDLDLSEEYSNVFTDLLTMNISSYISDYQKSQELKNKIMTNI